MRDEIICKTKNELVKVYADVKKIDDKHRVNVLELAEQHGIPSSIANGIAIEPGEKPDKIVERMYVANAKQEAKHNMVYAHTTNSAARKTANNTASAIVA